MGKESPDTPAPSPHHVEGEADTASHEHRSTGSDQRLWLEAIVDQAATMRLHAYCLDCGAVRSRLPMRGRPMGYFERAIANLKTDLERHPTYPKLAQVHSRLIAKALEKITDFGDPYSMDFETQWDLFLAAVQRVRPDLDLDFLRRVLPREERGHRPAYINLIDAKGGAKEKRAIPV